MTALHVALAAAPWAALLLVCLIPLGALYRHSRRPYRHAGRRQP